MTLVKKDFNNQHVIITGGGSGLGYGLASRYLKKGAIVSVLDLHLAPEQKSELEAIAHISGSECHFFSVNVTDAESVEKAVSKSVAINGSPDIAINSAGILINKALEDTTPEAFKKVVDVNLNGSFNFASAIMPLMKPGSQIALIASVAGLISNYGYTAYGASKFGVVGLATTLRYEYEHKGIKVSCVCPPEVKTPMVAAEHANGDPVSLELKKFAGSLEPEDACSQIFAGIESGKWMIIPSFEAKSLIFISRVFPGIFTLVMRRLIKFAINKVEKLKTA
jgi:3-dehydrosphinganine reductase